MSEVVLLAIERHRLHAPQGLVVEIGEACIDLQILELAQHLDGIPRPDREADIGVLRPVGRRQHRHHGQRRGDRGDTDVAGKTPLQGVDLLMHGAGVADDAPGPVEHPLALRREALEPRSALHQEHAEGFLELLDAGGEGGLADAAGLGGVSEVALAGERDDEFELFDHAGRIGLSPQSFAMPDDSVIR
jgi:hypothetical protein